MKIRFTPIALDDLVAIRDYLNEHNGEKQSIQAGAQIRASIDLLVQFPYIGRLGEMPGTRVYKVKRQPYVVIYRVGEESIEILHLYHERQQ